MLYSPAGLLINALFGSRDQQQHGAPSESSPPDSSEVGQGHAQAGTETEAAAQPPSGVGRVGEADLAGAADNAEGSPRDGQTGYGRPAIHTGFASGM